jgi:hypothetical protein
MSNTLPPTDSPQTPRRNRSRMLGLLLIIMAALLAYYLLIIYLGWQSGQQLLSQQQEQQFAGQLTRQVELAQSDIEAENYALAVRRLEWVLAREPQNNSARSLYATAQEKLQVSQPSPASQNQATPTTTPLPSPTPGLIDDPAEEMARIDRLIAGQEWSAAISALHAFRQQFPTHEQDKTDRLLFDAYIELGLKYMDGEQPELGLFYLSQAERLGDLPEVADEYRVWAELYTQGISFYAVNWEAAAYYFRDLCAAAPFYQNACQRLEQILIRQGDVYAFNEDWCPAEIYYHEAQSYSNSPELAQKLSEAREGCLMATPTPSVPITGTQSITDTRPITDTSPFSSPLWSPPTPEPAATP